MSSLSSIARRLVRLFFTPQKPLRRLRGGLVMGLLVGALMVGGLYLDLFSGIRTDLRDTLYQPRTTTGTVVIIAIDDTSLGAYGRSTTEWPRRLHADMVRLLDDAGARVIVFDVLFADVSEDDDVLAVALNESCRALQPIAGNQRRTATTPVGELITYDYYVRPTERLATTCADRDRFNLGHVNIVPDGDGFVRRVPLLVEDSGALLPALSVAAYAEYLRLSPDWIALEDDVLHFGAEGLPRLDVDDVGQMLISYFGPPSHPYQPESTFPVYTYVDVLEGTVPPEVFSGKIVLIGALDAAGLPDSYGTPSTSTGERMFGVEIHANALETIIQSRPGAQQAIEWRIDLGPVDFTLYEGTTHLPLREQSLREQMAIAFLLALGAALALHFLRWYVGLVLVVVVYGAYFFWASASFTVWSRVVELLFPAFALGGAYLGTMIGVYIFEERRRGQINDLFSRYVSAEIAQKIVEQFDRGGLELGGEEREITVIFADVRGFTSLSEGLPPRDVVALLNIFLEEMNTIVLRHGGAINKYIGDNLMAFWNAPYEQADHAWLAVQAGLEMLSAIQQLNDERQFQTPVHFGIGINTGTVVVGNIGSSHRLEYTPIGDTVNVASRLSGTAPGGACYIGGRTHDLVADRVTPVNEHHLLLKGKRDPIAVYELRPPGWTPDDDPSADPVGDTIADDDPLVDAFVEDDPDPLPGQA